MRQESAHLVAQIFTMHRDGVRYWRIASALGIDVGRVVRVLDNQAAQYRQFVSIDDVSTVQGEFDKNGWPVDEDVTTESIYAAAEAIRERRPRSPQGYPCSTEVAVARSRVVLERKGY